MKNFFVIIFLSSALLLNAQEPADTSIKKTDKVKLCSILGVTAGAFVFGHAFLNTLWWKGEKSSFHFNFEQDWKYSLGADKIGHFYFPYVVTNFYYDLFCWSGLEENESLCYAASLALFYQTYIEIRDGFSKKYGFSWGDYAADIAGTAYPVFQDKFSLLKNFNFKISFYPSEKYRNHGYGSIIDDYESTYHWLTIDVKSLLPETVSEYYPGLINLALGHSVTGLGNKPEHEFYLSMDWNLERLPGNSWFLKFLKRTFNYYHLPSPAVRIYPSVIWYGLKF